MTGGRRAAQIAQLDALIAELVEQMQTPAPPTLRKEQERGLEYAQETRLALLRDDVEELARLVEEERRKVPRALQSSAALRRAQEYVHVARDMDPWQVWIRFDAIPAGKANDGLRRDVDSLAAMWRDIIKGRKVGRPKKGQA